jgi:iron complex outermembrane receptor protein
MSAFRIYLNDGCPHFGIRISAFRRNFEEIPSYTNVNAQLGWETGSMTIALYAENLLNNDEYRTINPANSTTHRYRTLRPRTIGLRIGRKL